MRNFFRRGVFAAVAAASLAACSSDLTVPNFNSPTVEGLSSDPAGLQLAATGILVSERNNYASYTRDAGVFGREAYYYFPTDARYVTDYLIGAGGALSSTGFAAVNFFGYYRNQRNAYNLVNAANGSGLSEQQKAAARGFANTFRALDLYYIITTRDTLGSPVDIRDNPNDQAPFVSRDSTYKYISALLETAKTDLTAAGSAAFPFTLHSGFNGFNTPATFRQFNRAIAARVYNIRSTLECGNACATLALGAVNESFIRTASSQADLDVGVYNIYSASSGDALNALSFAQDPNTLAHASIVTDAQNKVDGTPDNRLTRKVTALTSPRGAPGGATRGINATQRFTIYPATNSPTPIIRNEELLLIRAEANLRLNNLGASLTDLNNVRTVSGGLAPLAVATTDALLYERRYSLLLEGMRWIDARRYGRLNTLPLDLPSHFVAKVVPIPKAECDARAVKPVGC